MKRHIKVLSLFIVLSIILSFSGSVLAAKGGGSKQNTEPGQVLDAAIPNLSTPAIITDDVEILFQKIWIDTNLDNVVDGNELTLLLDEFGNPIPIEVTEDISEQYTGTYPGQVEPPSFTEPAYYSTYIIVDGQTVDLVNNETGELIPDGKPDMTEPILMTTWLADNEPWYPQARSFTDAAMSIDPVQSDPATLLENLVWNTDYVYDYANSWQADWIRAEEIVTIDFIDWGNPIENTNPLVGYRFPVELFLFTRLDEDSLMTAYKTACAEYPSSADELYAISGITYESYYATVLTNKFYAEVEDPKGGHKKIDLEPAIGPSGKMNFASAVGGWVPEMAGTHRIYFYVLDPLISFEGAIINNDEHYVMDIGLKAEELSKNKTSGTVIIPGATYTWIDVEVLKPNSNGGRKVK